MSPPDVRARTGHSLRRSQIIADRAFAAVSRFLHIEAMGGVVLLLAAAVALIWANSPWAGSYHDLWHLPVRLGLGDLTFEQPLHFWINDALMTVFFLVVGMEVRREIHDGSLSDLRQASLPIAAAVGGVMVPAILYLGLNSSGPAAHGWAVPVATDIAFAVGVLALLGKSVPGNVRVFLLALAIIDDIIAVLIIAFFYSGGLDYSGFAVIGAGILMVVGLHWIGVGTAWAYVVPGLVVWVGFLVTGAHPTLAGVVLGLMTPVRSLPMAEPPITILSRMIDELRGESTPAAARLHRMNIARRELLPPVIRVQSALHPWVAYGVMPLFALANAGITLDGVDVAHGAAAWVVVGVTAALVIGKPLGIVGASWLMVRMGFSRLPPGVNWNGIALIGLLAGIGFTMSIFIAMLAFTDPDLITAAKLGVLLASVLAALSGLIWGWISIRRAGA